VQLIKLVEEELRFKFYYRGRFSLGYNKGKLDWGDFYLSRPNFFPVYSPSGRQVTTSSAYRYNHHRSIFLGHALVNGINFFHDNNPTLDNLGDIALVESSSELKEDRVLLRTRNDWVKKSGERVLVEDRGIAWRPGEKVHALDISCTLTAADGDVLFDKEKHSFFGIRVADSIDVEDGGRVLNANGEENEEGAMGKIADWVDYSGTVAGATVGVTLMNHPDNPPSPYFVRNYGTILSNFTYHEGYELKIGEKLTQHFRVLVHEGGIEDVDIGEYMWREGE
jgi:hypothetical protein